MTVATTSRDTTIRHLRAYPITAEAGWVHTLGAPFVVAAASFMAAVGTGITWLIAPAIVAGPSRSARGAGPRGDAFLAA